MKTHLETILRAAPFNLDADGISWIDECYQRMTPAEKLGQLFVLLTHGDAQSVSRVISEFQPAGICRVFTSDLHVELDVAEQARQASTTPLLISADLEGSLLSLPFGTQVPNPLSLAAIDDIEATREICQIMANDALRVGLNWSFTPVLDINALFRSAIVATRGFGSDPDRIRRHALAQIEVFQANGIAATAKHWPGEGYDDRDQHLVTTVNPLSMDEWEATFGELYRSAIKAGVKSVMSAHIALPAFISKVAPELPELERFRPATISRHLNETLLREHLGFNGLIVSDATPMGGFGSWASRAEMLPEVIENGCDLILFSDDITSDIAILEGAIERGVLSQSRVEEAIHRTLGLKASLGLHLQAKDQSHLPGPSTDVRAREITQRAPTLVKDIKKIHPVTPVKYRKIYLYQTSIVQPIIGDRTFEFADLLRKEGFEVTVHEDGPGGMSAFQNHDLVMYVMGEETIATRERIYMNWLKLTGSFGAAMQRPWHDLPAMLISFGYPYYLYDSPRLPCVVNAYAAMDSMQEAVIECLVGRAEYQGRSPVDPFCGLIDARY